ncbi:Junctional adhesion molecule-like [Dissostichus eleginoides]|uniref:Junctional adhesion molecule-like n=1 Tax=Dissostichus eleginoides TaxID=100907 RepID=A0AAD9BVD8_DISEL|nr:Junctional adhesion molecule-like [Dissostichus eleginoides]
MDEFKQIEMSSLLILLLQFTGPAIGQSVLYLSVRVGDEATLTCNSVRHDQDEFDGTTWLFSDSGSTVALVDCGQIGKQARAHSDRLRVTEKCSLVIKKVTEKDAGYYTCRQFRSEQQGPDSHVYLFVVTMTEHQDNAEVTLNCSVKTYGRCRHSVKWLFQGEDTAAATTESDSRSGFTTTASVIPEDSAKLQGLLRLILVSVGLAALIMIVVVVSIWTRAKEKQTQMDEINVCYDVDDDTVNYENIRPPDGV